MGHGDKFGRGYFYCVQCGKRGELTDKEFHVPAHVCLACGCHNRKSKLQKGRKLLRVCRACFNRKAV